MQFSQLLCVGAFWLMSLCDIRPASASAIIASGRSPPGQNLISPRTHYSTLATLKDTELPDLEFDGIDKAAFDEILEMDDDDEHDFSKNIVFTFFGEGDKTLSKMDEALAKSNLNELSALGHFLRDSSGNIGLTYVQSDSEKIYNFGRMKDAKGDNDLSQAESLKMIKDTLPQLRSHLADAKRYMERFYAERRR